jgi:hypothetical protein
LFTSLTKGNYSRKGAGDAKDWEVETYSIKNNSIFRRHVLAPKELNNNNPGWNPGKDELGDRRAPTGRYKKFKDKCS